MLEKVVVQTFFCRILTSPSIQHLFKDQFAFRPTGSTTAALIYILQQVSLMLQAEPFVYIIALDFSKAFDTVSHSTLTKKMADFPLPDNVYNWAVDFLEAKQHCTRYRGNQSDLAAISASIIQGSGFGPCAYNFNASDLQPSHLGNLMAKYADDTYVIVPASNATTISSEIRNVADWALLNNLKLNETKCFEMVVRRPRLALSSPAIPQPTQGMCRVTSLKILGVVINDRLDFTEHVGTIVSKVAGSMYALRVLRAHGLEGEQLWEVTWATALAHMLYASPAWCGYLDYAGKERLHSVHNKLIKQGFLSQNSPHLDELHSNIDAALFNKVLQNMFSTNCLPQSRKTIPYSLRPRTIESSQKPMQGLEKILF